jgi:hypothetical protein
LEGSWRKQIKYRRKGEKVCHGAIWVLNEVLKRSFCDLGMESTDRPGTTGHDAPFRPSTRSTGRAGEQALVGSGDDEHGGEELERSDKAETVD